MVLKVVPGNTEAGVDSVGSVDLVIPRNLEGAQISDVSFGLVRIHERRVVLEVAQSKIGVVGRVEHVPLLEEEFRGRDLPFLVALGLRIVDECDG